ncbi:MAG: vitamin B12-dependent ribonucleotide reductase [Luteolibacter sp.]
MKSASTVDALSDESVSAEKSTTPALPFERHFAKSDVHPFDDIKWARRTAEITDDRGKPLFRQENVEVPESWSELATKIAVSKYFYGDASIGNDPATGGREHSVRQLVGRVSDTIADWGLADGYFDGPESAAAFRDDLTWLCLHQHGAFNSPVWFNVGLHHKYGIGEGKGEGGWHWEEDKGEAVRAAGQYHHPQASACFIQSVTDNMEDIMRLASAEAMLFKYGSGTGSDLSPLRSTREKLSGGGKPSGPLSFLRIYDQVANAVKSGGKTRRAAKMNTLKDWHPDIEEFIEAKTIEEKKAWALIEQGYDGSYNGDAYGSVMFQNENLSIRASDEFMQAACDDGEWWTRRVVDGEPCEKKSARELLRKIAEGTHTCGDPGMQFDTTIHTWHTCKGSGRQHSTNPCSEYLFLNDTACNLASLNLLRFQDADGRFQTDRFLHAVRIFITAQEILVDRASYPTREIAENSHAFRTLGLGYANLGALIMSRGFGYDSDEGRALAGAITALMTGKAYEVSAELSAAKGPFPSYHDARYGNVRNTPEPSNEASMRAVIERHHEHAQALASSAATADAELAAEALKAWEKAVAAGIDYGYRNAQVTVLAPTGTIGFLMDCDTTGIEPDIALVKYKLLAGGGMLKIVNRTVPPALKKLGYPESEIAAILAHIEQWDTIEDVADPDTGEVQQSGLKPEHLAIFDCAFKAHHGTRSLHYRGHLRMMAAAQPFLSGAISKTVNLPESATVEDIMQTYIEAWQLGLKAVAIYRDGSKRSAPLSTRTSDSKAADEKPTTSDEFAVRLRELAAENDQLRAMVHSPVRRSMTDTHTSLTHKFEIAGHKGYLTVGLYPDGQPGEIFIQMSKEGSTIGGLMDTVATLTSIALQYGVPLEQLVNKFAYQRFEPSGYTRNPDIRTAFSITDYVFRWLGCQFIDGYRAATAPDAHQPDLPLPEITEMERAAVNRPVPELSVDAEEPPPAPATASANPGQSIDRVRRALGTAYMGILCSNCGSDKVIRAGACGVCTQCGTSQGCS